MKRAAIAIFTATTLAFAGACSHETEAAPVSQETFLQESIDEATLRSGHSNVIVADITFARTNFNVRETPQRNADPKDNLCGEIGGLVLNNAVVVVSSGHPDWDGDWISVPDNVVGDECDGDNAWINGRNIQKISATLEDGTTITYSANRQAQFQEGDKMPENALPAGPSWLSLAQLASNIDHQQSAGITQ